ncbi:helix-turn-helix domain-containing protein [Paenibacillus polymyxa]|uniref:helix-turn-helix domain-containing protein n=1 Tax=Paenibacillus polymyxa TaxID=1406 RepID=UPI001C9DBE35|nr:helix-turn-helix domain-containing protein [Paenibacillus polymyxa]MBY7739687.1 helix-turn-helix domain-containing protein [Paenibacillus polymyxa]
MNNHQRLVSVETQMKYSITSGSTETRIFVKFYVEAVCSGMMPIWDRNAFLTLIVLASYMGADGTCYPTQWQIANNLGIKRETAGRVSQHSQNIIVGKASRSSIEGFYFRIKEI